MRTARKILAGLLCITVGCTSSFPAYADRPGRAVPVDGQDPGARVIRVTPEAYPALARKLSKQGYRPAKETVALNGEPKIRKSSSDPSEGPPSPDGCGGPTTSDDSLRVAVDATGEAISDWGAGGDESAVVFVVIGAVVVVVWTLYAFKYLFDLAAGVRPCDAWSDFTFSSARIDDHDLSASFNGVRFLTGVRNEATDFGISAQLGYSDIELPDASRTLHGTYWLVGPLLRWSMGGNNPHYFQMEFLGGSTEHEEVGIIAQATAGVSFGVGNHFRWGVNIGALNIDLSETRGIVEDRTYRSLLGIEMGYRF